MFSTRTAPCASVPPVSTAGLTGGRSRIVVPSRSMAGMAGNTRGFLVPREDSLLSCPEMCVVSDSTYINSVLCEKSSTSSVLALTGQVCRPLSELIPKERIGGLAVFSQALRLVPFITGAAHASAKTCQVRIPMVTSCTQHTLCILARSETPLKKHVWHLSLHILPRQCV